MVWCKVYLLSDHKLLGNFSGNIQDLGKETIIVLDWVDESEITPEINDLIIERISPNSTIIPTERPEAKYLKTLSKFLRYQVTLHDTDMETVNKYMEAMFNPSNEEELKVFQDH